MNEKIEENDKVGYPGAEAITGMKKATLYSRSAVGRSRTTGWDGGWSCSRGPSWNSGWRPGAWRRRTTDGGSA